MIGHVRSPRRAPRFRTLAYSSVCLAAVAGACGPTAGGGGSSGGGTIGTGTGGSGASAGTTGTGGAGQAGRGGDGAGGSEAGRGGTIGVAGNGGGAGQAGTTGGGGQAGSAAGVAGQGGGATGRGGQAGGAAGRGGQAGGAAGRGGQSGSGGQSGTGGQAGGSGTGGNGTGSAGRGGAAGGSTGAGGAGGSSSMGSNGCGKTSTLTFTMVPGENANAAAGSGNGVGHGDGGYVTVNDSKAGGTRGFALRLPDNYDKNKPYWLIFGWHWNGGNAAQVDNGGTNGYWWSYYGLQRKSNNGAIFVAPDGLGAGWANTGGRDLAFADDMLKLVQDNYCVDTTHIITAGFSYGGGMSYELACARGKTFRAAVIYEGGQLSGCDGGNDPIALWQTEGLTDMTVNMSFATPIRDRFVKNNGCTAQNAPEPPNPPPYINPGGHVCTNYAGCSAGHPLRWCVHQSGHTPGPIDGNSDLYNSCATPPKSCSTSCPCTWTPDDVWSWLTSF